MKKVTLSELQEQQLVSMRPEVEKNIKEKYGQPFKLLLFTFYPMSEKYGASILLPNGRVFFGSGESQEVMVRDLVRSAIDGEFVVSSEMVTIKQ
jgi:hypothetical protein